MHFFLCRLRGMREPQRLVQSQSGRDQTAWKGASLLKRKVVGNLHGDRGSTAYVLCKGTVLVIQLVS